MRHDIVFDETGDLSIGDDLVIDESDNQHTRHLMEIERGDLTQFPTIGVGIFQYLKGSLDGIFRRNIQLNFEADGYVLQEFTADTTTGAVNVLYKSK